MRLYRKLFIIVIVILFLTRTAIPVYAHDVSMGGSDWSFYKNRIKASIELNVSLLQQLKEIDEKHLNLEKCSNDQLKQIAADIIQPYIDKKLYVWVNGKGYPVKVNKLIKSMDEINTLITTFLNTRDPSRHI